VDPDAEAYLEKMYLERGYALEYHRVMVENDFEFARTANALAEIGYMKPRRLDAKTKELLFIVSLATMRASRSHIQTHVGLALEMGVDPGEIFEALELVMLDAGIVAFQEGVMAWSDAVKAQQADDAAKR
jgi:4-carboxymuconolactone decarboxylase